MKKVLLTVIVMLFVFPCLGFAGENYLQARYGEELDSNYSENYFILENNRLKNWDLGTKIVVVNNGFTVLNLTFSGKNTHLSSSVPNTAIRALIQKA